MILETTCSLPHSCWQTPPKTSSTNSQSKLTTKTKLWIPGGFWSFAFCKHAEQNGRSDRLKQPHRKLTIETQTCSWERKTKRQIKHVSNFKEQKYYKIGGNVQQSVFLHNHYKISYYPFSLLTNVWSAETAKIKDSKCTNE